MQGDPEDQGIREAVEGKKGITVTFYPIGAPSTIEQGKLIGAWVDLVHLYFAQGEDTRGFPNGVIFWQDSDYDHIGIKSFTPDKLSLLIRFQLDWEDISLMEKDGIIAFHLFTDDFFFRGE
jgi:hypothetical protein